MLKIMSKTKNLFIIKNLKLFTQYFASNNKKLPI